MIPSLALTILVDNTTLTDRYFVSEPGLSIFLETEGRRILFDTGYSDVFFRNAEAMGIDLLNLDVIVLSHGHLDHTWGLVHLIRNLSGAALHSRAHKRPALVAHPYCFYPKPKAPLPNTGSLVSEAEAARWFSLTLSHEPLWITENLVFLGEIPRIHAFEQNSPGTRQILMPDGQVCPDRLLDDSSLACRTPKGLVIITGCSHAGICNIVSYAQEVCGEQRVLDIVGGFHLLRPSAGQLEGTCNYLKALAPAAVHACHCTSLPAKIALSSACRLEETGVGLKLKY
ncbi:MAG: MBL fold metallo-hydrolase [Methanoregula sp.]|jgi:7,8-dihydropterin-6-yl-methyl-4-(beta-D-ribofuranosyl)aminobenzene 5'-phosphate synthase